MCLEANLTQISFRNVWNCPSGFYATVHYNFLKMGRDSYINPHFHKKDRIFANVFMAKFLEKFLR
jgi:hypothetical protein